MNEQTFTIEEIKNYILSQDSLGDVLYNLNEENINKANEKEDRCGCGDFIDPNSDGNYCTDCN